MWEKERKSEREREAAKHMATGTQRDFRREQELQRESERDSIGICVLKMKCQIAELNT